MRTTIFFLASVLIFSSITMVGQSKIKCDLVEVTSIAFNKSPVIKSSYYTIQDAVANVQVQSSVFDYKLSSGLSLENSAYTLFTADPRNQFIDQTLKSNSFDFSIGFQKKFRTSQTAELSLKYLYNNSNFPFNSFNEYVGPYYGNHSTVANFSVTQPLLRGRGKEIATVGEKVAKLAIDSNTYTYEFTNSYEILQIGLAYWNYYVAYKSLDVYVQNETRVRNVLDITKELVKADKKPEGDLAQVNADLTNQERLTAIAKQNLYNARLNLGRTIGLSDQESQLLDNPSNDFPMVTNSGYATGIDKEAFIKMALEKRADLKALQNSTEALGLEYKLAENGKRPQLDLTGYVFYGGAGFGDGLDPAMATFSNNEGQNIGGGAKLTFSVPLNNNLAKGSFTKSKIALDNQTVVSDNATRNMELNINTAVNNLHNSVQVLQKAKESFAFYQEAFNNEQIKFQTGLTTLLNLILFQERLTFSELEYLNAQQQFSNAILYLRHETGTLISKENNDYKISQNSFYTIPNTAN